MIVVMLQDGNPVALPQIAMFALLSLTGRCLTARFMHAIPPRRADEKQQATIDAESS